ncbi:serine/threonine protein kinase [Azospirillum thermophilum]|uniref:Serine/threonine protein kinase n=2 Tax=Azospirillum thermophilum TaxID=2202148 RepID=A0A2S2CU68_9PROT|nr:serine/threonine protein kinase [Azospirillum thermophilum]
MIDEAEPCGTLAEFHGPRGRMVLGIVLRQYLESLLITPTEAIHHAKLLKTLMEQGQLVENAAQKVATVQARQPGQDQRTRRLALQAAIDETWVKARAAQVAFAGRGGLDAVLAAPPGRSPTGDRAYDLRVALSLQLAEIRSWTGKLDRLLELQQWDRDPGLADAVDGAIGDLLAMPAASQELLGTNLLMGGVLVSLCELLFGRVAMEANGPSRLGVLNALFRQDRLPQARAMVLDRIRRQLRAPQPLGRGAFDQEAEYLRTLTGHLLTPAGLVGGPPMADALTVRYSRRLEQGGASAYRRSLIGIAEGQADLICRIHYLVTVAASPAAERHLGEIADALDAALGNELLVENMVLQTPDVALVERSLAAAVEAVRSSVLPPELRARLAGRLAFIVDEYARRGLLVARLRQIETSLRRRTIRLAELACSGLVREEGALPMMRQHIMEIVRQPQFQAELSASSGGETAQAEVRRLFELLDKLRQTPAAAPQPSAPLQPTMQPALLPAGRDGIATVTAPPAVPPAAARGRPAAASPPSLPPAPSRPVAGGALCPCCFAARVGQEPCRACGYPLQSDNRAGIHLTPGSILQGRYRTGRVLGQGGFGATYLGWDERLQVKVAVKEFYPANLIARTPGGSAVIPFSDEHARSFKAGLTKFLDEARMLARLRDIKEIVGVQDFFEENGTAYLVMELLDGRTMKKVIAEQGGRLDVRRTLAILTPIMKALQAVHEQGFIHRDISPDNIFVTNTGEKKLLDFGAARQAMEGPGLTVILKPGFAPPEQYSQEGRQGPWSDVYALCATAYLSLTGKTPPDATTRFMNDRVPRPGELCAGITPAFEKVILSGLAMRWQDRPQSMRDLLRAMTGALGG